MAVVQSDLEQCEQAIVRLGQYLRIKPMQRTANIILVMAYLQVESPVQALEIMRPLAKRFPSDGQMAAIMAKTDLRTKLARKAGERLDIAADHTSGSVK